MQLTDNILNRLRVLVPDLCADLLAGDIEADDDRVSAVEVAVGELTRFTSASEFRVAGPVVFFMLLNKPGTTWFGLQADFDRHVCEGYAPVEVRRMSHEEVSTCTDWASWLPNADGSLDEPEIGEVGPWPLRQCEHPDSAPKHSLATEVLISSALRFLEDADEAGLLGEEEGVPALASCERDMMRSEYQSGDRRGLVLIRADEALSVLWCRSLIGRPVSDEATARAYRIGWLASRGLSLKEAAVLDSFSRERVSDRVLTSDPIASPMWKAVIDYCLDGLGKDGNR